MLAISLCAEIALCLGEPLYRCIRRKAAEFPGRRSQNGCIQCVRQMNRYQLIFWRLHMRKVLLLASVLLMGAAWAIAQDNTSQPSTSSGTSSQTASASANAGGE